MSAVSDALGIVRGVEARFLTLEDVADLLSVSRAQAYALVRSGDLPAIKLGGRGQWRIEKAVLEAYIERKYAETRAYLEQHPDEDSSE